MADSPTANATSLLTLFRVSIGGKRIPFFRSAAETCSETALAAAVKNDGRTPLAPEAITPKPTPGNIKTLLHCPIFRHHPHSTQSSQKAIYQQM